MLFSWRLFRCKCLVFEKQKFLISLLLNDIYCTAQNTMVVCTFRSHFLKVVLARRMGTLSTRRPRGAPNPRAMRGNGPQNPDPKPTRGSTRRTNSTHQAHAPISPLISSLSQLVHQLVLELAYPRGIP